MESYHRVIVGGGFAGAYCAQALESDSAAGDVLLLDRNDYFVFSPLLVEAGTGALEPRHAVVAIRTFLKKTAFRMGEVQAIDFARHIVSYRLPESPDIRAVGYQQLVLALGSTTRYPDIPGLREYSFKMKTLTDAVILRDRAIRLLELADSLDDPGQRRALLHFVVVGGNSSGAEVAGEFHGFLRAASRAYRQVHHEECRVTLIEISDRILRNLDPTLSTFATDKMRQRGMQVLTNTGVVKLEPDGVHLSTGGRLPTRTVIWCAGIEPNPLVRRLALPRDERGYILCERDLRVRGHDDVWAIGDCAAIRDPQGELYPATAQHAIRQAAHLAGNLVRARHGRPTTPCDIVSKGSLAALGCRTGVAYVFGVKVSGFLAWFLWRTVYLLKMPGLTRKIRVALDWTMELLFPREYVQLGVHHDTPRPTVRETGENDSVESKPARSAGEG